MKITVGLPAFNEEKNIASIIAKLQDVVDKVIVCNDGSTDSTGIIAEKMGVEVINHPKNFGYGASIRSIFLKARDLDLDILVTFDADSQHRIEDIKKVVEPIVNDQADIVIGSRFLSENENDIPEYRKIGIKAITKLTNTATSSKITDSQSGFRAYNKKTLQKISPTEYGMGVSTEILIKANEMNFRIVEVPIVVAYEGETSTHHPVSHGTSVILSTMKFISIEHPLKFYGIPGIIFLMIGLSFIIWTVQIFAETSKIVTNISLIGIGSAVLGIVLLMNAIILFSLVNVVREKNTK